MDDFIPTRATQSKKNVEKLYEVTTYKAHKKKEVDPSKKFVKKEAVKRKKVYDEFGDEIEDEEEPQPVDKKRQDELEMKRFRYDVIKLGMSAMEQKQARHAKIALAVSLGAVPPKNRKMNYKKLIEKRKLEKLQEAKKKKHVSGFDPSQLTKNRIKIKGKTDKPQGKSSKHGNKNKKSGGILDHYGKVNPKMDHKKKRKCSKKK